MKQRAADTRVLNLERWELLKANVESLERLATHLRCLPTAPPGGRWGIRWKTRLVGAILMAQSENAHLPRGVGR